MVFQIMSKGIKQIIEAHRGSSGYAHENTIAAFELAHKQEADAIELDIRKTKDNQIIVTHDPDYNGRLISEWNYLDLLSETKKNGFEMPLLIDVLNLFKDRIILDIEIKEEGYEEEIINIILSVMNINQFYIRSFSEKTIKKVKEINNDVYSILLIGELKPKYGIIGRFREIFPKGKILRSNCDAVSPHYRLLLLGFVRRMHRKNLKVYAWTINDDKIMKKVFKKKVDGIVTNYPDIALKVKNNKYN